MDRTEIYKKHDRIRDRIDKTIENIMIDYKKNDRIENKITIL
jgi:hypothetical protein